MPSDSELIVTIATGQADTAVREPHTLAILTFRHKKAAAVSGGEQAKAKMRSALIK